MKILIISFSSNETKKKEFVSGYKNASMRLSTLRYLQREFLKKVVALTHQILFVPGSEAINKLTINQVCFLI
jgi:hypothetical protein